MDEEAQRDLSPRRSNLIWSLIGHDAQSAKNSGDLMIPAEEGREKTLQEEEERHKRLHMKTETERNIPDWRKVLAAFTAGWYF